MLWSARCVRFTAAAPLLVTLKKRFERPPLSGRIASVGLHVSLPLQAIQRCIDSADGNFAARPRLNLLPDSYPVGFLTKPQHGQKDDMLEFTEVITF